MSNDAAPKWPTAPPTGYPGITTPVTFDHETESAADDVAPSAGYEERWRTVARLHALGKRNQEIAALLQYTDVRVSILLKHPWVQAEVERYRKSFDGDVAAQVREAATDGIQRIHRMILDEGTKDTVAADLSKWAVEKATGKATQQVNVQNNTLNYFVELMKRMQGRGETLDGPTEREALPAAAEPEDTPQDTWNGWLDQNL